MFGSSENSLIMLDESHTDDIPQVSDLENGYLTDTFSQEKVRAAIFQIEHKGAWSGWFPPRVLSGLLECNKR
jgi:hypothetical protein